MVYRFDTLEENDINPVTGTAYDDAWVILRLTEDKSYETMAGSFEGSPYTIRISKPVHHDWRMAVGDFICFHESRKMNCILIMTEEEMKESEHFYEGHRYYSARWCAFEGGKYASAEAVPAFFCYLGKRWTACTYFYAGNIRKRSGQVLSA